MAGFWQGHCGVSEQLWREWAAVRIVAMVPDPGAPVREEIPENIPDSSASEPELGPEVHRRPPKQLLKKSRCSSPIMGGAPT